MSSINFTPFGIIRSFSYPNGSSGTSQPKLEQNQTSISSQINQTTLINKVEKHIDDVKQGLGGLSTSTYFNIVDSYTELNKNLSEYDPKSLKALTGLITSSSYGDAARSVVQLNYSLKTLNQIPSEEESKEFEDEILKIYGKKPKSEVGSEPEPEPKKSETIQDSIINAATLIQNGDKIPKSMNDALGAYKFADSFVKDDG